jgi:putative CocE/NonD family hydrolase
MVRFALTGLALSIAAVLALPGIAGAKDPTWTPYDRPAQYGVVEQTSVPITMSDGVQLNALVHRPDAPGRFPVIVTITPYNGGSGIVGGADDYFVQRGYVHLVVDVRGTGSSGGYWDNFGTREQRDGYEVVEWAAQQPWSNGVVGMWGESYMAITQMFTAAQHPPHLKAIFPIVPMSDSYRDMVMPGGQNNVGFIPFWLVLVSGSGLIPPSYALSGNPDDLVRAFGELLTHAAGYASFVPNFEVQKMAGDQAYDGQTWKQTSPIEVVDKVNVPTFIVGGLHDIFQRGEPLLYERLKNRVPTRLLLGPWTHTTVGNGLPADGVPGLDQIALRWFDQYLKGMNTNIAAIPKVTSFVLGDGHYATQADWPDPRLAPTRMYVNAGNTLTQAKPTTTPAPGLAPSDTFLQNPVSGICTQSTSQWSAGLLSAAPCTTDNRLDEATDGVQYTTAPLSADLRFSGPAFADVWVTTTASDAVVSVRVNDVAPDGTVTELTDGWLAGTYRAVDSSRSRVVDGQLLQPWHPFTEASVLPVAPGQPTELKIEVFPTNAVIKAGHQLRLSIGPNDFPHAVPPLAQLADSLGGVVTVLHDPQHLSYVALPVLSKTCGTACKPLPVPNLRRG